MWLLLLCGCYIYILSPEIIQIIPKHIGYNYYDHTITRTTHAQNPTIALSVMQIKGIHLGFYIDFMVIFKTCGRNEFLTPKYPRIEVLFYDCSPRRSHFTLRSIQHICSFTSFIQYAK